MTKWSIPRMINELGDSPGWTLLVMITNFLFLMSKTGSGLVIVRIGTSLPASVWRRKFQVFFQKKFNLLLNRNIT